MNKNYFTVIMAGGIGSRFWPLSKKDLPKQFHDILGTGETLLQSTYKRFTGICPKENIFFVTNENYREIIKQQLPEVTDSQILGEPSARNTAPCIAYAANRIMKINPDAAMVIAPSDHIINNTDKFTETLEKSLQFAAANEVLVTMGVKPTRPDTGYGYIQFMEDTHRQGFYKVKTFTEKPNIEIAKYFVETGEFLWNAGIFIMNGKAIINAYKKYLPDIYSVFAKGEKVYGTPDEKSFIAKTYEMCTMISIDYGIMEKADNVYVIPAEFEWSDIGTWNALYELVKKDENGNVARGDKVFMRNSHRCIVFADDNDLVALNGVENLIVVDTGNILLIANLNKEQEIRQLVNELRLKYGEKYL